MISLSVSSDTGLIFQLLASLELRLNGVGEVVGICICGARVGGRLGVCSCWKRRTLALTVFELDLPSDLRTLSATLTDEVGVVLLGFAGLTAARALAAVLDVGMGLFKADFAG